MMHRHAGLVASEEIRPQSSTVTAWYGIIARRDQVGRRIMFRNCATK